MCIPTIIDANAFGATLDSHASVQLRSWIERQHGRIVYSNDEGDWEKLARNERMLLFLRAHRQADLARFADATSLRLVEDELAKASAPSRAKDLRIPAWANRASDVLVLSSKDNHAADAFARTVDAWGLSQAEAARVFGVSRQAVGQWQRRGVPPEFADALRNLAVATDLLVRHIKRDRIPAVVRRPIPAVNGVSLLDLFARGDSGAVLAACRDMFRFDRAQD